MARYTTINELTDEEIFEKIRDRDTDVFTALYTHYFYSLSLLSLKYVKDVAVSEEIVQDVFLKIWETPLQLNNPRSLGAYLSRVVINNSVNYINRQKNIEQHHLVIAEGSDLYFENSYDEQELRVRIYKEIESLPVKCRTAFKMSRFEGLTYREIASKLGIVEKTVENHVVNALKILRRRIFTKDDPQKTA